MKILMIEDDKLTTEVIRLTLEVHDPNSSISFSEKGRDGLEAARKGPFDVVLLDLGLPDIDGIKVLEELKEFCTIPIMIVSARHDPTVIANALNLGAADYILKPFNLNTLLIRLKDLTARLQTPEGVEIPTRITQGLSICCQTRQAFFNEKPIELSPTEWRVLNCLIEHRGRIVPTSALAEMLPMDGIFDESGVNLTIASLRKKLGDDTDLPKIIISEYSSGYRLVKPVPAYSASKN